MAFLHINAFDYTEGWTGGGGSYTRHPPTPCTTPSTHTHTHALITLALTFEVTLL